MGPTEIKFVIDFLNCFSEAAEAIKNSGLPNKEDEEKIQHRPSDIDLVRVVKDVKTFWSGFYSINPSADETVEIHWRDGIVNELRYV